MCHVCPGSVPENLKKANFFNKITENCQTQALSTKLKKSGFCIHSISGDSIVQPLSTKQTQFGEEDRKK